MIFEDNALFTELRDVGNELPEFFLRWEPGGASADDERQLGDRLIAAGRRLHAHAKDSEAVIDGEVIDGSVATVAIEAGCGPEHLGPVPSSTVESFQP